jgi:hypothetical protein
MFPELVAELRASQQRERDEKAAHQSTRVRFAILIDEHSQCNRGTP